MTDQISLHTSRSAATRRYWPFVALGGGLLLLLGAAWLIVAPLFVEVPLVVPNRMQVLSATWVKGSSSSLRLNLRLMRHDQGKLQELWGTIFVWGGGASGTTAATVHSKTVSPDGRVLQVVVDSPVAPSTQQRQIEVEFAPGSSISVGRYWATKWKLLPSVATPPSVTTRFLLPAATPIREDRRQKRK